MLVWAAVLLPAAAVASIILMYFVVKHFQNAEEAQPFTTAVIVLSLTFALFACLIIPLDVYNVSRNASIEEKKAVRNQIQQLYCAVYGTLTLLLVTVVPFAYFLHEEADDPSRTLSSKVCTAARFTAVITIVAVALFVGGLLVYHRLTSKDNSSTTKWVQTVLHDTHQATFVLFYSVGCMAVVGTSIWSVYTSCGVGGMPMALLFGLGMSAAERNQLEEERELLIHQQRVIRSRYARTGDRISEKDMRELERLRRRRSQAEDGDSDDEDWDGTTGKSTPWWVRCIVKPAGKLTGLCFLAVSCFLCISWLIGLVDQLSHSSCGWHCGFVIEKPTKGIPMDALLLITSKVFPMDFVVLGAAILYLFASTLHGLAVLGVRVLWFQLFPLLRKHTAPQALLLVTTYSIINVCTLFMQTTTLAPQYVSFGTQSSLQGQLCSNMHEEAKDGCVRSAISKIHVAVVGSLPIFGTVFVTSTLVFLGLSIIFAIASVVRARQSASHKPLVDWGDDDV